MRWPIISWGHCLLWYCWLSIEITMPTIDWNENSDYQLKVSADYSYRLKWWWNEKGQLSIEMKIPTTDWKWNCRSCLCDYPVFCLSIGLLIGNERPSRTSLWSRVCRKCCTLLELGILLIGQLFVLPRKLKICSCFLTIWLSLCLSDYRMKMSTIDWKKNAVPVYCFYLSDILTICLSFWLSIELKTADERLKLPFLSTVSALQFEFLSTIEVLDACVNQYQYWPGKERSRGKDVFTFQTQFARLRDQSTTHFIRNTVSFFLWSELTNKTVQDNGHHLKFCPSWL